MGGACCLYKIRGAGIQKMKKACLLAGITIFCWGLLAAVSKRLLAVLDTMQVLAYTSLFATAFLLAVNLATGRLRLLKRLSARALAQMVGTGLLGVYLYRMLLFLGISRLPAQTAFVLNYLWPAFTILFGALLLKETMTAAKLAAVALSALGVLVNTAQGSLKNIFVNGDTVGMLCCVGAALLYGLYAVLNKKEGCDKFEGMLLAYLASTVCAFGFLGASGRAPVLPGGAELAALAFVGVVCNALPYLTWALALDRGDTAILSNLAYLTPFVSLGATHVLLGEPVTVYAFAGLALITAGIAVQIAGEEHLLKKQRSRAK